METLTTVTFSSLATSKVRKHFEKITKNCKRHGYDFFFEIKEKAATRKERVFTDIEAAELGVNPYKFHQLDSVTYDSNIKTTEWELVGYSDFKEFPVKHLAFNGFEYSKEDKDSKFVCAHCGSVRKRNKKFIVRKDGELVSLGSECVKAYLDINPNMFSSTIGGIQEFEIGDFYGNYSYGPDLYDVETIVNLAAIYTLRDGYKKSNQELSTKETVLYALGTLYSAARSENVAKLKELIRSQMDKVNVKGCIEFWMNSEDNTFNNQIKEVISAGEVSEGWVGILAYTYEGYLRHLRKLAKEQEENSDTESNYVGVLKERLTIKAKAVQTKTFETQWGTSHLVTLTDVDGNVYTTFTSGNAFWLANDIETGEVSVDEVQIKGTVKDHKEFRGTKQTMLSRLSIKAA